MEIDDRFIAYLIGSLEGLTNSVRKQYFLTKEAEKEPKITVFLDDYPTKDDLCVDDTKGGDTVPPRYADGCFRQKRNRLEYRFSHLKNQISVYGRTKEECFDKRTAIMLAPPIPKKINEITIQKFFEDWYQTYKLPYNGQSSLNDIRRRIECIYSFFGHTMPLNNISSMDCQKLINTFADKPNSQDKLFDVLNGGLEMAYKNCLIKRNPCCTVIKTPYKAEINRPLEFFEQQKLWDNLSEKYKTLFFFACCTGIRIGRILELTREDIDFEHNEIIVFKKQRKGLKETYRVPFLPELFDIVPLPDYGRLFSNVTRNSLKCHLDGVYKKTEITNAMIHTFRHTFVSTCYFCGIDLKKLQLWAGHSTFDLTMNVYTHLLNKGTSPILEYLKKLVKTR